MAEAKFEILPFAADALHTNALAASKDAARKEEGADYYGLQRSIAEIGRSCLVPGSRVVDLRCDLKMLMPLVHEHEDLCKYVVLSPNDDESWKCFDRLRTRVRLGFVDAVQLDLRSGFPEVSARMVLAIEALGGLSEDRRADVAESMHRRLERNGTGVIMEEVEADGDDVTVHTKFGIAQLKERRPWSAAQWEAFLTEAGFSSVTRIWSDGNRVAWSVKK